MGSRGIPSVFAHDPHKAGAVHHCRLGWAEEAKGLFAAVCCICLRDELLPCFKKDGHLTERVARLVWEKAPSGVHRVYPGRARRVHVATMRRGTERPLLTAGHKFLESTRNRLLAAPIKRDPGLLWEMTPGSYGAIALVAMENMDPVQTWL